ncbi:hypothetical protein SERLA73DRAFT_64236 [Serpula lacrymans var. lacrymans S7.3]|uniref:Endonuclease/exonuclease/phosphatase domain-containing protein n=1 Tax=Serpula lacrymans var. lacrymans (strain S7.3) TaxID=936435 RepID=F8QEL6_SERL3|nr:hypothetical protein SERLA73DRAFT_64236 [Serpula lacrymans var. lacrymans S7.3]
MPPKGKAKRKAPLSDDEETSQTRSSKKTKKDEPEPSKETSIAPNGQPTNKVLPVTITFPPSSEGHLKLATWNICGLAASQKKGFRYYIEAEDPDILVLTETKVNDIPVDPSLKARFPFQTWSISAKKTYSGTAILSKHKPLSVDMTLPGHPDPDQVKGRIITLEFEGCYLIATYVVNAGQGLKVSVFSS